MEQKINEINAPPHDYCATHTTPRSLFTGHKTPKSDFRRPPIVKQCFKKYAATSDALLAKAY
jgi:hypothetical protein